MIKRRMVSLVCAMLSVAVLLMCTSCELSTYVVSDAENPDVVLDNFFTELKAENYEECDKYLADNATFVLNNTSRYDFTEKFMEYQLKYLEYELVGDTVFDGVSASQQVKISAPDMEYMARNLKQNISDIEYEYLVEQNETAFDKENPKHVSDVVIIAMEKYFVESGQPKMLNSELNVEFKYQDSAWKIQVDEQLVAAIFGGTVNE